MLDPTGGNRTGVDLRGRDGVRLLPYSQIGADLWSLSDDVTQEAWRRAVRDRTIDRVFPETDVSTPDRLRDFLRRRDVLPVAIAHEEDGLLGFAWLTHIRRNSANGHFLLFREAWRTHTQACGLACLDYWFSFPGDGKPLLDVLLGWVPSRNRLACRAIASVGFVRVGTVPLICAGDSMDVYYITRESHHVRR